MITSDVLKLEDKDIFNILNPIVRVWFKNKFKNFALPQSYAVMPIHCRENILISSPTGSGKTLTAFLAILNELIDCAEKGILQEKIYAVYVSPLRALSKDIHLNLTDPLKEMEEQAGKELGIRVGVRTGDTPQKERTAMLKKPPHILVCTPETLAIVLSSPKFVEHLKEVQWFIADEVHALAENKRGVHLSLSMERLAYLSLHMARIGLSATIAPLEEVARFLVGKRDCKIVDVQFLKQMDLQVISPVPDLINVSHEDMHNALYATVHKLVQQHTTTLIFTNTRAGTERVVDHLKTKYPGSYHNNIGAHHGSLSAEHRNEIEQNLRHGKLKIVACSTSLELGIDIGYIDLVICLGSPKSVARALQRIGRSGHQLHSTTEGRIIVLDRDDLVECAVLLKAAIEKKIDKIHIPKNALDVLAQHLYGMAIDRLWDEEDLFEVVRQSYCYETLKREYFDQVLSYLAGEYASLEDRHVYAKIWRRDGQIGRRGKLARVIYMTNIGTIPDQTGIKVKIGDRIVGSLDEGFLEKLRPGDVFVLGGNTYQFKFSRGMVAQVTSSVNRPPTVPSWVSEMLPLSFDLSMEINRFRFLMDDKFKNNINKKDLLNFVLEYLYVDTNSANAIYQYFYEQFKYAIIPTDKKILIENYTDEQGNRKAVFHSLFGRRVNDVLSRAVAYSIAKSQHKDVEIGINDNGFYLGSKGVSVLRALKLIKANQLRMIMEKAIDGSEVLKRRFRHCAGRSLMILRNYMGRKKRVGRQQVSSMILMSAVKRISNDFSILLEARREVLEDQMDIKNAEYILWQVEQGKIKLVQINTDIPSPFAFKIALQGVMDVIKMEDKMEFLQRMHQMVMAKISLKKTVKKDDIAEFSYNKEWDKEEEKQIEMKKEKINQLKEEVFKIANKLKLDHTKVYNLINLVEGEREFKAGFRDFVFRVLKKPKGWPKRLIKFMDEVKGEV